MQRPYKSKIRFFFLGVKVFLPDRKKLKRFIHHLFEVEHKKINSVNFIFCSDNHLIRLNKKYLNHNTYTDVITFDLSEMGKPILAEIYISTDRVKENSKLLEVPLKQELYRVLFHGALHLCGYNDKNEKGLKKMRAKEGYYLNKYVSI